MCEIECLRLTGEMRCMAGALVMMVGGTVLLLLLVADVTGVFALGSKPSCSSNSRSDAPS